MINSCPKAHCHRPFRKINIHTSVKVAISSLLCVTLEGNCPNPSPCHVLHCVRPFGVLPSILDTICILQVLCMVMSAVCKLSAPKMGMGFPGSPPLLLVSPSL